MKIRQNPSLSSGGAKCRPGKDLNNIRHSRAKREDSIVIYGGLRKKIKGLEKKITKNSKSS